MYSGAASTSMAAGPTSTSAGRAVTAGRIRTPPSSMPRPLEVKATVPNKAPAVASDRSKLRLQVKRHRTGATAFMAKPPATKPVSRCRNAGLDRRRSTASFSGWRCSRRPHDPSISPRGGSRSVSHAGQRGQQARHAQCEKAARRFHSAATQPPRDCPTRNPERRTQQDDGHHRAAAPGLEVIRYQRGHRWRGSPPRQCPRPRVRTAARRNCRRSRRPPSSPTTPPRRQR